MSYKHKFSFERKQDGSKTIFVIHSPANTTMPKIISFVLIFGSSLFLGMSFVDYILGEGDINTVIFLTFFVCFAVFLSIIFFARFTVIYDNYTVTFGSRFWRFHRIKTISTHDITSLRWDTAERGGEYFIYLIVETLGQTYKFQPLKMAITQPQPYPELQQFLDAFLEAIQQEIPS